MTMRRQGGRRTAAASIMLLFLAQHGHAQTAPPDVQFDPKMLFGPANGKPDLSRFERGMVPPGDYDVDVSINGRPLGRKTVHFVPSDTKAGAEPCLDNALVQRLGLDPKATVPKTVSHACLKLTEIVAGGTYTFSANDLQLDFTVPQAALLNMPRDYVDPALWDAGVNSATLEYGLNVWDTSGLASDTNATLSLRAGVNVGSWHLRQVSNVDWDSGAGFNYQDVATYVEHDIPALDSQLVLGESFTDGTVFDSVGLRGVQLATDERMWPQSLVGFAPAVRGVAHSQAKVEIYQNGLRIYQTTVPAGAFEISDLYATGYGGDLDVVVTEADGSQEKFTVPFAAVPQLLRAGMLEFSVSAGQLRDTAVRDQPWFLEGTIRHGFSNLFTAYGGAEVAEDFAALAGGVALNTGLGAVSADITQSFANIGNTAFDGQQVRVAYKTLFTATETTIGITAAHALSDGYFSFRDAAILRSPSFGVADPFVEQRQRGQYQVFVSQQLPPDWGNFTASVSRIDYWNSPYASDQYQFLYNNQIQFSPQFALAWSLSATRTTQYGTGLKDDQIALHVTIPLSAESYETSSTDFIHDSQTGTSVQEAVNGAFGDNRAGSYYASLRDDPGGISGSANGSYRTPQALFTAGASAGPGYQQFTGGISGGIVLHPEGVTLANTMSDTIAVVTAKDAEGAQVSTDPGVTLDSSGNAVVATLTPYRLNTIEVDPKGTSSDVQLQTTSAQIAPRAGAVVAVHFDTVSGRAALITLKTPQGESVEFGAEVKDTAHRPIGVVGQKGLLFASGLDERGRLVAKWGDDPNQSCEFDYQLPPRKKDDVRFPRVNSVCEPLRAPEPHVEH